MNKNLVGIIVAIIIVAVVGVGFAVYRGTNIANNNPEGNMERNMQDEGGNITNSNDEEMNTSNSNGENMNTVSSNVENNNTENTTKSGSKILVAYYSAQKHTKTIAETIAKNLNADILEIVPEEVYTSSDLNWSDSNSRVTKEHDDESLRDVKLKNTKVENWKEYDTVLIGYPIWWGIAAWPINNFVKENNFDEKTVIPFCTSASSSLGQSGKLLEELAGSGNWQEGHRFSSSASSSDIQKWTDTLK